MSPGTHSPSAAAHRPSTPARGGPAAADGARSGGGAGSAAAGEPVSSAADGDGPDADTDARATTHGSGVAAGREQASTNAVAETAGDSLTAPGGPIDALERIVIGSVGITTQALAHAAPEAELTFSQWRALLILGDPPTGYRVGEVATRVGVTLPATSRLLRRLARRGLVSLTPDATDRRATRATLTDQGATVRDAILAFRRDALRDIAEHAGAAGNGPTGEAIDSLAMSFERYA